MSAGVAPSGPYVIKGSTLPDDVPAAIKDIQPYIDGGNNPPALEFLSPVKGPSLEQITVAVGSGLTDRRGGRQAVRPGRRRSRPSSSGCRAGRRPPRGSEPMSATGVEPQAPAPVAAARGEPPERGVRRARRRRAVAASPTRTGSTCPAGIVFGARLHRPDGAVVLLQPDPLDAVHDRVHRPGQLRPVLQGAVAHQRRPEHDRLRGRHQRPQGRHRAACWRPLLTSRLRSRNVLRSVVFFPVLVSTVAVGITFAVLMHPSTA